jgi:molybdate transport system substrate-binding protein
MPEPIAIIASMAPKPVLVDLLSQFRKTTGRAVTLTAIGGVEAADRIKNGEAFDVAVLAREALVKLATDGHVLADSIRDFARSPTAVAVRAGAPRASRLDAATLKEMIARAGRIAVSTGPSGRSVRTLLETWRNSGLRTGDILEAPPGVPVARLVAAGDAELGFQQLSELLGQPGIDIVGPAPETLLPVTVFSLGICRTTRDATHAEPLVAALVSQAAAAPMRRHGMEPPQP